MRHDAFFESRGIADPRDEAIHGGFVEVDLVHEHVGTVSQRDQVIRRSGVPGNDDRPVGCVETIGERRHDGRVIDDGCRDAHVAILEQHSSVRQLVHLDERRERHTSLVRASCRNVVFVHLEE